MASWAPCSPLTSRPLRCASGHPPRSPTRPAGDQSRTDTVRSGDRLDSMAVVAIVPATGASAVVPIPRNTRGFPLPDDLMALWQRHCQDGTARELLNSFCQCLARRARNEVAALCPDAADPAAAAMRTALGELRESRSPTTRW